MLERGILWAAVGVDARTLRPPLLHCSRGICRAFKGAIRSAFNTTGYGRHEVEMAAMRGDHCGRHGLRVLLRNATLVTRAHSSTDTGDEDAEHRFAEEHTLERNRLRFFQLGELTWDSVYVIRKVSKATLRKLRDQVPEDGRQPAEERGKKHE